MKVGYRMSDSPSDYPTIKESDYPLPVRALRYWHNIFCPAAYSSPNFSKLYKAYYATVTIVQFWPWTESGKQQLFANGEVHSRSETSFWLSSLYLLRYIHTYIDSYKKNLFRPQSARSFDSNRRLPPIQEQYVTSFCLCRWSKK